jgi:hypothetical protein
MVLGAIGIIVDDIPIIPRHIVVSFIIRGYYFDTRFDCVTGEKSSK